MMVPAPLLQNLPLHAIPVQGKPWIEQMPMGYAPTAAILRFERAVEHTGALVAGDSRGDLPGAAEECRLVGTALAAKPLIGQNCTRAAIEQVLREEKPDIVHFAMHGRGDTRSGGRSSLLMADGAGNVQWIDFDSLTSFPWTARLVVFSGCSTGLIGLRHGHQLLSVANAALEAGAASVIASLWPVDDEYAKSYMAAFYQALNRARRAGPVDLRAIMNEARNAVRGPAQPAQESIRRDGRRRRLQSTSQVPPPAGDPAVDDALTWAPFCLFGAPILQSSPAA